MTAGKLFSSGTVRLGQSVLNYVQNSIDKKLRQQTELHNKKMQEWVSMTTKANEIKALNIPQHKLKISQLKCLLKPLKRDWDII